ncbi:VOC family protein [Microlunatus speluncae]|uniref:VOC family protein n=1 Tax=Microlunatus speluncae TaxID=2594267 RepID=UPI0012667209|nr:VOC family protein [Microlunatus speluncae]
MAGEIAIPLLPCRSIDEIEDFYRMLGFERTYRQAKPYPCVGLQREDLQLQFFGLDGFDPETSYGSCVVLVEDTMALYEAFAAGMRAVHGKVLISGLPRMTRPRKRKNVGNVTGFSIVDPGGNWIRVFRNTALAEEGTDEPSSQLGTAVRNAVVLGDSKGDVRQAARILDGALNRHRESAPVTDLVEALAYAAELAVRLGDRARADVLLAELRAAELTGEQREGLSEALANSAELEQVRTAGS